VNEASGNTCSLTGILPDTSKVLDHASVSMEDPWDYSTGRVLKGSSSFALVVQKGDQLGERKERKHAAFLILGRAGIEPDCAGVKVDLPPRKRQDLSDSPSCQVSELHDRLQILREVWSAPRFN